MKTLEEIRTLFVEARIAVKTGKEEFVKVAAENLRAISDHCKEVEENEKSYLEKAKSKNLYESLDNIIAIIYSIIISSKSIAAFASNLVLAAISFFLPQTLQTTLTLS